MNPKESIRYTMVSLVMPCLLLLLQAGCTTCTPTETELRRLQGYWEGEGPPGKISISITADSLHFFARTDFWYAATFILPAGTGPQRLDATIRDSSPPANDIGEVVFAIYKIEEGRLTLAVSDGSDAPPATFADATSRYELKRVTPQTMK